MSRLTYLENEKWCVNFGDQILTGKIVERLAAYENSGLEPEELKNLLSSITAITKQLPSPADPSLELKMVLKQSWKTLPLSARAFNCLLYISQKGPHRITTVEDLANMKLEDILRIQNCGKLSRTIIAEALQQAGIPDSDWYRAN